MVTVTYRSATTIASVERSLPTERIARWVVVDNASDDDTVAIVRGFNRPNVEVVAQADNVGFGAGNNVGAARATDTRWLLFLNPDAAIDAANLEALVAYAARNPRVGMVAPRLRCAGEPITSAGRLASLATEVRTLLPHSIGRVLPERRYDAGFDQTGPVGYVEGACMLVDANSFREIGAFDERFFLFFEEMDLAQRLAGVGREVHLLAEATAEHLVGASRATLPGGSHPELLKSTIKYFEKWHGRRTVDRYRRAARAIWWLGEKSGRVDPAVVAQRRQALR